MGKARGGGVTGRYWTEVSRRVAASFFCFTDGVAAPGCVAPTQVRAQDGVRPFALVRPRWTRHTSPRAVQIPHLLLGRALVEHLHAGLTPPFLRHQVLYQSQQRAARAPARSERRLARVVQVKAAKVERFPNRGREPAPALVLRDTVILLESELVVLGQHEHHRETRLLYGAQEGAHLGRHLPADIVRVQHGAQRLTFPNVCRDEGFPC
eukprot:scaffold3717_cov124-Isochrysis_galbana.AAC.19